jgi:hypothetical protein
MPWLPVLTGIVYGLAIKPVPVWWAGTASKKAAAVLQGDTQ